MFIICLLVSLVCLALFGQSMRYLKGEPWGVRYFTGPLAIFALVVLSYANELYFIITKKSFFK